MIVIHIIRWLHRITSRQQHSLSYNIIEAPKSILLPPFNQNSSRSHKQIVAVKSTHSCGVYTVVAQHTAYTLPRRQPRHSQCEGLTTTTFKYSKTTKASCHDLCFLCLNRSESSPLHRSIVSSWLATLFIFGRWLSSQGLETCTCGRRGWFWGICSVLDLLLCDF